MVIEIIIGIVGAFFVLALLPFLIPFALSMIVIGAIIIATKFLNSEHIIIGLLALSATTLFMAGALFFTFLRDESAKNHDLRLTARKLVLSIIPVFGTESYLRKIARINAIDATQKEREIVAINRANECHVQVCHRLEDSIKTTLDSQFACEFKLECCSSVLLEPQSLDWKTSSLKSEVRIFFLNTSAGKDLVCRIAVITEPSGSRKVDHYYKVCNQYNEMLFHTDHETKLPNLVKKCVMKFAKRHPEYAQYFAKTGLRKINYVDNRKEPNGF